MSPATSTFTGLRQVAQHAADLDRATAFYRDTLGLRHIATFDPPGLVFFDLGDGTRLLIEENAPPAILYLAVDDIHATVEALRAKDVSIEHDPHMIFRDDAGQFGTPGTEEWMAFVKDSEGNTIGLSARVASR